MKFTYVQNDHHDPRRNLALEESLFREAQRTKEGFLMLWSNDPTVVVGRFQNTAEEVNREFTQAHGIYVVRRITGGGAVYHDHGTLNYSVILPTADAAALDIHAFGIPLLEYLSSLGIKAERTGRNDVTIGGRKFSGVAQHSGGGVILHHGTLLFDSHLDDVEGALKVKAEKFQSKGFKSVQSRVTNLASHLPRPMNLEEFQVGFAGALIDFYQAQSVRTASTEELQATDTLFAEKYSSWDWTWGVSPAFSFTNEQRFAGGTVQIGLSVVNGLIERCRFYGDFFSLLGTAPVESRLLGRPYPLTNLEDLLSDELLKNSFTNVEPSLFRAFLMQ